MGAGCGVQGAGAGCGCGVWVQGAGCGVRVSGRPFHQGGTSDSGCWTRLTSDPKRNLSRAVSVESPEGPGAANIRHRVWHLPDVVCGKPRDADQSARNPLRDRPPRAAAGAPAAGSGGSWVPCPPHSPGVQTGRGRGAGGTCCGGEAWRWVGTGMLLSGKGFLRPTAPPLRPRQAQVWDAASRTADTGPCDPSLWSRQEGRWPGR